MQFFELSGGEFDKLPANVINFEIFPYLSLPDRVDLQCLVLRHDERVCHGGAQLNLTQEQLDNLKEITYGKIVMGTFMSPSHVERCARIRANLYNPARFSCGVRQMYEMLSTHSVLGQHVPRYMSLLTLGLMKRQDDEFETDEGQPPSRNRLAYRLAWKAAGRFSNVSTPASSRRSSTSNQSWEEGDEEMMWDMDRDGDSHRFMADIFMWGPPGQVAFHVEMLSATARARLRRRMGLNNVPISLLGRHRAADRVSDLVDLANGRDRAAERVAERARFEAAEAEFGPIEHDFGDEEQEVPEPPVQRRRMDE